MLLSQQAMAQGGLWAQMHGSAGSGALGWYGTKGVPDVLNTPSGRYQGAFWTDKQGNFWLFGGFHPWGYANDLWKYDVPSQKWTWMNGPQSITDQNGEFGVKGIPSANNYPSARTFGPNCWTDTAGNLWLFGGYGYGANGVAGGLSDLWKYDIGTNMWTWIWGPDTAGQSPVFGTMGIASASNTPGSRAECKSGWVDAQNNLWMFGGQDGATATAGINVRNDVWKYNIATNQWTWMKGSQALNNGGTYGTKGVEAAANNPPARLSFTKWKGKDGNFYLFAGGNNSNSRNDLWRFNPFTTNWTWISGAKTPGSNGNYNATCHPEELEFPAARIENQTVATTTCTEVFWSFGGFKTIQNTESYYDLWL
ncbi:MAG TPA: kelch repeat-containing protein, partial [Chitinophagaceae bacterium]|nr:kelch repeat-containing protein [Chitinophagaceae bacterium]